MGALVPPEPAVTCAAPGDCRHRAAGPGQSPARLPVSRHAPAAHAAAVTAPRAASHRAPHPVPATAVARRLSQRPTALAGARGARAPAGTADGGARRRPTAAGDGNPVHVPPSRARAPLCRGSGRAPPRPLDRPPSGPPVSGETGGATSECSGPPGAAPAPRFRADSHLSPGSGLLPHDPRASRPRGGGLGHSGAADGRAGAAPLRAGSTHGCSGRARRAVARLEPWADGGVYPPAETEQATSLWAGRGRLSAPPPPRASCRGGGLGLGKGSPGVVESLSGAVCCRRRAAITGAP
jgi:hypothetical protein